MGTFAYTFSVILTPLHVWINLITFEILSYGYHFNKNDGTDEISILESCNSLLVKYVANQLHFLLLEVGWIQGSIGQLGLLDC